MIVRIAVRRMLADRGRSAFLVISLALVSFVLLSGVTFVDSLRSSITESLTSTISGQIQAYNSENPPLKFTSEVPVDFLPITSAAELMQLLRGDPAVASVVPRSMASAMLLADGRSTPTILMGIDSSLEADTVARLRPDTGRPELSSRAILVGRPVGSRLGVDTAGANLVGLIATPDGLFDGDSFEVAGTYAPPGLPLIDEFVSFVDLEHLQSMLGESGMPRTLVIRLIDGANVELVRDRLQLRASNAGISVSFRTWRELADDLLGIARMGDLLLGTGLAFLLIVVMLGVGNVCLVLMLSRVREAGLLRALGTPRQRIFVGLMTEVGLLCAIASILGTLVAVLCCGWLSEVGIPATSQAMSYAFGGDRFYPRVRAVPSLICFVAVVVVGTVAAVWPALRTSAIAPAESMRHAE